LLRLWFLHEVKNLYLLAQAQNRMLPVGAGANFTKKGNKNCNWWGVVFKYKCLLKDLIKIYFYEGYYCK
jgi:hypothetical protein